ncbi:condensation domain protein [Segniliparus rotundus DSM 44985]|uniref:Condensation domain protein n=1 Tax=Segniliparus rotundus (strain ATCC BAA-972 / CDC 1076 / CIP 108378 / DSM 44985 / JCM 13578) TaxID=640132 RepID=D6ZCK3_SEGRD|nr:condensation domain-containing protein [Segniliparus rotundus]ADG97045.1 condensation domain protein [Segniliparus rotundus DSM 44985]
MEFVELFDYPITPGRVTHWMAHAETVMRDWPVDPRPASFVHEAHLRAYTLAKCETRESWIGTALEFEGELDHAAFARTLRLWADRHEVLRSQVELVDLSHPQTSPLIRRTLPEGAADFVPIDVGDLHSATAVHRELSQQFDTIASPSRWPGYVFSTLERDDGTFTVLFVADHSLLDGYSIYLLGNELVQLYRQVLVEAPDFTPEPAGDKDSYVDFSAEERVAAQAVGPEHPAVRAWDAVLKDGGAVTFPLPLEDMRSHRGKVAQRGYMSWLLDSQLSEDFSEACKAAGGNYQAGIIAALALSTKLTSDREQFSAVMPFHTRNHPRWAESLGWFVGVAPMTVDLRMSDSFSSALPLAQQTQQTGRLIASVPYARVRELLGPTRDNSFLVSFINGFAIPGIDQWQEWRLRGLRSKNYSDDEVALFFNRSPSGLVLCGRYPNTETASRNVHKYLSTFRRIVVSVAETGEFALSGQKLAARAERLRQPA